MTLAVAHRDEDGRGILDALRECRPPFSPEAVVEEFSALLRSYGVREVEGDRYAGEWPRERFRVHSIEYRPAELPKAEIYRDFLPILNSGRADLLDHARLINQIAGSSAGRLAAAGTASTTRRERTMTSRTPQLVPWCASSAGWMRLRSGVGWGMQHDSVRTIRIAAGASRICSWHGAAGHPPRPL